MSKAPDRWAPLMLAVMALRSAADSAITAIHLVLATVLSGHFHARHPIEVVDATEALAELERKVALVRKELAEIQRQPQVKK